MHIVVGTKGRTEEVVTREKTAETAGSGLLPVYGTPFMIALMELTALKSVQDQLDEGESTVGTVLQIKHVSPSPVGIKVWVESEVTAVEGRKITFDVKAYDEKGLIGEGVHERFVIDKERFMAKCQGKLN
jgi:fluoroacetyl-CoA thioesterase